MILYNITFALGPETERDFLHFMRESYLPGLRQDARTSDIRLHRIHPHQEDPDSRSYALHIHLEDEEALRSFAESTLQDVTRALLVQFGERVMGFSTIMHTIED